MDAQEIKTAVAHQDAEKAAAEAPFVNLADPARALGAGWPPAVSRRAPIWEDVPDEQWNDWRWQLSHRVNDLAEIEQILEPDRRGARGPVRRRTSSASTSRRTSSASSTRTIPTTRSAARSSRSAAEHEAFTGDDGGLARRGPPLAGARARPPLPGPRPDAGHDPVRELLPVLHAVADRRRPDPELQPPRPRGPARVPAPDPAGPRRPHLRRRRPDPRARSCSRRSCAACARSRTSRSSGSARACRSSCRSASTTSCARCSQKYHPLWINLHFNHPNEITPGGLARGRQADQGRPAGRQPERAARRRQRLRAHPARARPQARRQPDPAVLPVPVRPRRGLRPLPDAGRQGPRDHGGPARPHLRLRGADLRHRCARWRRQDPGHAQLPHLLLRPQGRAAQLRGLHHDLRGARARTGSTTRRPASTASTSARSPASPASSACSRASGCGSSRRASRRSTAAATPRRTGSRTRRSGCRSASGRSRAQAGAPLRVLEAGDRPADAADRPRLRPGRGAATARGRADRVGPRGAALAGRPPAVRADRARR